MDGLRAKESADDLTFHGALRFPEELEARAAAEIDPLIEKPYLVRGLLRLGFLVDELDLTVERLKALGVPLRGKREPRRTSD